MIAAPGTATRDSAGPVRDGARGIVLVDRPWAQWLVAGLTVGLWPATHYLQQLGITNFGSWQRLFGLALLTLIGVWFAMTPITSIIHNGGRRALVVRERRAWMVTERDIRISDIAAVAAVDLNSDFADQSAWRRISLGNSEGPSMQVRAVLKSGATCALVGRPLYAGRAEQFVRDLGQILHRA